MLGICWFVVVGIVVFVISVGCENQSVDVVETLDAKLDEMIHFLHRKSKGQSLRSNGYNSGGNGARRKGSKNRDNFFGNVFKNVVNLIST